MTLPEFENEFLEKWLLIIIVKYESIILAASFTLQIPLLHGKRTILILRGSKQHTITPKIQYFMSQGMNQKLPLNKGNK